MDIENLCQYNSNQFLKLLGLYIQQRRQEIRLSLHEAAAKAYLNPEKLDLIEHGLYLLNDQELAVMIDRLSLSEAKIVSLAKITQVQEIIQVTRELNANFPS